MKALREEVGTWETQRNEEVEELVMETKNNHFVVTTKQQIEVRNFSHTLDNKGRKS